MGYDVKMVKSLSCQTNCPWICRKMVQSLSCYTNYSGIRRKMVQSLLPNSLGIWSKKGSITIMSYSRAICQTNCSWIWRKNGSITIVPNSVI